MNSVVGVPAGDFVISNPATGAVSVVAGAAQPDQTQQHDSQLGLGGRAAGGTALDTPGQTPVGRLLGTLLDGTVRVTHRPGSGPGRHAYQRVFRDAPFPVGGEGCVATFEAQFDRGFEWGCRGKVGGLSVGPGESGGGEHSRRGASLRLMWDEGGGAYAYVYVPSGTYGMQPAPLDERMPKGQAVFADDYRRALVGRGWHRVSLGVRLNSVGRDGPRADGELFFSVDGVERTLRNVVWRTSKELKIEEFTLGVFHGGGCRARRTSHSSYRNIQIHEWP